MEACALRTEILGVGFDDLTIDEAADRASALMEEGGFHYVVTPNPEMVDRARRDAPFRAVLNGADLVLPDGIGVVHAAKLLGRPLKGRVTGFDFACDMLDVLDEMGGRLYLLGAKPGVAEAAAARLEVRYPGLVICGTHDGYFQEDGAVVEAIRASGADAVFVCLGFPKQERWMADHGSATGARLMAGLGGSLDVFAGVVERAPESWQRLGLEWLYRLTREPKRIGRMARLPLFLAAALGERGRRGAGA